MSKVSELADQWRTNLGRDPTPNDEDALVKYVWKRLAKEEKEALARAELSQMVEEELRRRGYIIFNGIAYKAEDFHKLPEEGIA